jgi:hypothetical protein
MHHTGRFHLILLATLVGLLQLMLPADRSGAQDAKQPAPAAAAPPRPAKVSMPEAEKIVLLTRTTLLTLNDAMQTGNYTVLRDVAAPGFREANSAGRLSAIFSSLAEKGVDLTAVAILTPQLSEPPVLDEKAGMVRIKGQFPGQPVRLDFEVIYQAVAGRWRLFGLSVQPTASAPTAFAPEVTKAPGAPPKKTIEPAKAEPPRK